MKSITIIINGVTSEIIYFEISNVISDSTYYTIYMDAIWLPTWVTITDTTSNSTIDFLDNI